MIQHAPKLLFATALALTALSPASAQSQGLFGLLRGQDPFAPVENSQPAREPLNILPVKPKAMTPAEHRAAAQKRAGEPPSAEPRLNEYAVARRVNVPLPRDKPGRLPESEEVASAQPEVVDSDEIAAAAKAQPSRQPSTQPSRRQTIPMPPTLPPQLASYANPRLLTDGMPMRPAGLRETEHAVAGMPGVFADEDAEFSCLPQQLKQVLVDTAARFGHVAILNAKRSRGSGARQSYHYQCRAVDFRVRGVALRTVYSFLRNHPDVGGRKIYPMGFFHIDDGPSRSW